VGDENGPADGSNPCAADEEWCVTGLTASGEEVGYCADVMSDPHNCGVCGQWCWTDPPQDRRDELEWCCGGVCVTMDRLESGFNPCDENQGCWLQNDQSAPCTDL
jgi:hypothetical protein